MPHLRRAPVLAPFLLGTLTGVVLVVTTMRPASLQAQQRITLQSLQDQVTALQNQVNSLSFANIQGTVSSSQLSGSYANSVTFSNGGNSFTGSFNGSGAGLTNLQAGSLVGNLPDARLSSNVPLLNANNLFSGATNSFTNKVGIGTSSPSQPLTVAGNIATSGLLFPSVSSSNPAGASPSNAGGLYYNSAVQKMMFSDGNTWRTIQSQ